MSRKNVKTRRLLTAQSLEASFNSEWINIDYLDNVGFLVNCNNVTDNVGTFSVEVRMKQDENTASEACALTLDSVPTLNDDGADFFINVNQVPANQIRLVFTASGGTPDGDCDLWVNTKTVGA